MSDDFYRRASLVQVESDILTFTGGDREGMVALDRSSQEALRKVGSEGDIGLTRDEVRLLVEQADVVIHSHNDDTPFSIEDLAFAAIVTPRELIAFGPRVRWRLRREAGWPSTRTLLAAFNRVNRHIERSLLEQKRVGLFFGDPFSWNDRAVAVWERFQHEYPDWFTLVGEERHL